MPGGPFSGLKATTVMRPEKTSAWRRASARPSGVADMLTALIRMMVQALAQWSASRGNTAAPGGGRAYYGGVVTTIVFLPLSVFLVFVVRRTGERLAEAMEAAGRSS